MQIFLNGEAHNLPEHSSVADLIEQLGLSGQRLAIELNGDIAPRSQHATLELKDGDKVEIVRAIGGG
ncbi:MAG: sulfur carrier protein ThiS [Halothiobacillaceae bacterium]|nr:sulfur carrier protein ThiS [Halothiobacillaceae bacterium]OYY74617.1 MAG: sulfur carrier protein ThiS [Gammaproteobacteria bacterium 28-57-27]